MKIVLVTSGPKSSPQLKQTLESLGHPVIIIQEQDKALSLFQKRDSSELWIYDWESAETDFLEFNRKLPRPLSDQDLCLLILLVTPHIDEENLTNALKSGVHDFLL